MILIADSGSTKTRWSLYCPGSEIQTCTTRGINPFFIDEKRIVDLLEEEFNLNYHTISSIYFYGAGCTPEKSIMVEKALHSYFGQCEIVIYSDLLSAVHSLCQRKEGIVGILGTGSNSCYYDGGRVIHQVSPLGYVLGDEGSGAVMGKRLLSDILKKQLPSWLVESFYEKYKLTSAEILEKVYRQPFPNRFLAQFTFFLKEQIKENTISELVESCFEEFIIRNLMQYSKIKELPVHFTGSVAHHFKENLEKVMQKHSLSIGKLLPDPMPGLIQYYITTK